MFQNRYEFGSSAPLALKGQFQCSGKVVRWDMGAMHSAGRRGGPPPTPPPAKVSLLPLELLELLEPPPPPAPLPLLLGDARGLLLLRLLLLLEGEMEAQRRILTIFFLAQSTNWREKGKRGGEMCEIHMRGE